MRRGFETSPSASEHENLAARAVFMVVSVLRCRTAVALFIEHLQATLMRDAGMKAIFSLV